MTEIELEIEIKEVVAENAPEPTSTPIPASTPTPTWRDCAKTGTG